MSDCLSGLSPLARGTQFSHCRRRFRIRFIPAGAGNTRRTHRQLRAIAVYPRWRGEHPAGVRQARSALGLSPLARGTRCVSLNSPFVIRFIPAGAGNTAAEKASGSIWTVYPRWRGEHLVALVVVLHVLGLSPLARGTRQFKPGYVKPKRFIPAGAGNTWRICRGSALGAVYPRWRGEHCNKLFISRTT